MRVSNSSKTASAAIAAMAMAVGLAGAAAPAKADPLVPGVTGCGASGNKQAGGAVLGGLAGGLLGNSVSGHNRTTGTLVGAAVGAAAGSAVGCQMQHNDENRAAAAAAQAAPAPSQDDDYALANGVAPASYQQRGDGLVATRTVNLRATPDQGGRRIGVLRRNQKFQALAQVRGTNWILVGRDGVGVGYVQSYYTRSDDARYANR
jgi:hypothetical protein